MAGVKRRRELANLGRQRDGTRLSVARPQVDGRGGEWQGQRFLHRRHPNPFWWQAVAQRLAARRECDAGREKAAGAGGDGRCCCPVHPGDGLESGSQEVTSAVVQALATVLVLRPSGASVSLRLGFPCNTLKDRAGLAISRLRRVAVVSKETAPGARW